MNIPENAEKLISLIESYGFEAYAVGGCVRDHILGRPCDDLDLTSGATPFELEKILDENGVRYIETGLKHGTITVLFDGESYEVTTFRQDGEYFDSRHPESVNFVRDIKYDLSRRDFTINAMAYNNERGVVDLFGGQKDIKDRIIRTVGNADKRFNEDALRIMRALRFSSVLGFDIEDETKSSVFRNKDLLKNVSSERLFVELNKLLMGDNAFDVLMKYRDVIAVFIPEIKDCFDYPQHSKWHLYDVWEHICHTVKNSPKDSVVRLTMLFHDIGKPFCKSTDENGQDHFYGHPVVSAELTENALKRLKVSNEIFDTVTTLVRYHDIKLRCDRKLLRKWLSKLGYEKLKKLMTVKRADMLSQNTDLTNAELPELDRIENMIDEIVKDGDPFLISDLAVNGFDIMALGIKGKKIGETLDNLLELVINEKVENSKESLIKYIKEKAKSIRRDALTKDRF